MRVGNKVYTDKKKPELHLWRCAKKSRALMLRQSLESMQALKWRCPLIPLTINSL